MAFVGNIEKNYLGTPTTASVYQFAESEFTGLTGSPEEISIELLHGEIEAVITSQPLIGCDWDEGGNVVVSFAGAITENVSVLNNVIAAHTGEPKVVGMLKETRQYCVAPSTYTNGQTKTITLPFPMYDCIARVFEPNKLILADATLVSAGGTGLDCGNTSTSEANINNGNLTDLCYNNSSTSNTSGIAFGIDLGKPTAVNGVKRFDYSATYYDTEWVFWGSNSNSWMKAFDGDPTRFPTDPAGSPAPPWTEIFRHYQTAACLNPNPCFITFPEVTYQYYGVACVTSAHATYTIISELELYSGTEENVDKELIYGTDFDYHISADHTQLEVTNLGSEKDFHIIAVGKEDVE